MAYRKGKDGGMGWQGCQDSTPSSDPKAKPQDQGPDANVGNWRGLDDSTPSSSPERGKNPQKG